MQACRTARHVRATSARGTSSSRSVHATASAPPLRRRLSTAAELAPLRPLHVRVSVAHAFHKIPFRHPSQPYVPRRSITEKTFINPLSSATVPPSDPDHWPPTTSYPIAFWMMVVALLYSYLSDLNNTDAKDTTPTDDHRTCMHSRMQWAKHMLSLLQKENLFGIHRRDAAFDAFLPEIITDASTCVNDDVRRAALELILWLSDQEAYRSHLRPTVHQVTSMSDMLQRLEDPYEATQMLFCVANLFERLTPEQRKEAGPELVAMCRNMANSNEHDLLWQMQMRPLARLVYLLHKQPELSAALSAATAQWLTLESSTDPVVSAYGRAALHNQALPFWLDNTKASIGLEMIAAAVLTAAITPLWARWNTRWYSKPEKRVQWMSYATGRSIPAALLAVSAYYGLRALNSDLLPYIEPNRYSHTILGFGATAALGANLLLRRASPYWIVPSMLALNATGLSSRHLPFWFRATPHVTSVVDGFLREVPLPYYLGFEERLPPSPFESWFWHEHPPRVEEHPSRTEAFVGAIKRAFATTR